MRSGSGRIIGPRPIEKDIERSRQWRRIKEPTLKKSPKKKRPDFIKVDEKKKRETASTPHQAKYVREDLPYLLVRDNGN